MDVSDVRAESASRVPVFVVGSALAVLSLAIVAGAPANQLAPIAALVAFAAVASERVFAWRTLLAVLLIVILFIPIRRYSVSVGLPFELEPYRALAALVIVGWLASLLVDDRVRLRKTGLEGPLALVGIAVVMSVMANTNRIGTLGVSGDVTKKIAYLLSFVLVLYVIASVMRWPQDVIPLVKVLVIGGSVLSVFAVYETRTRYNVFDHLEPIFPFLHLTDPATFDVRGGRFRASVSGQHPIAFGAALAVLLPLALFLARTRSKLWAAAGALIVLGALSSVSRTSVVMLVAIAVLIITLRPVDPRKLLLMAPVAVVVIHFALPGTLGTLRDSFFPSQGLVAEQSTGYVGGGRIQSAGAALDIVASHPLVGVGYGSRILDVNRPNTTDPYAFILDNAWLGTAVETGILGVLAFGWLFLRFCRRLGSEARRDSGERGWFLVAATASVASYAVGMFTYDALSFVQVTFLMFVILGLGVVCYRAPREVPVPRVVRAGRATALQSTRT
jgi:hypothetical protein